MKNIVPFLFVVVVFTSCKTNLVYLTVTDPAPVTLSPGIKKVGVITRSLPSDDVKVLNKVHEVLSVENVAMLKEGSAEGVRGLNDALMQNTRFESVKPLGMVNLKTPAAGIFPSPLSWDEAETICRQNSVDALFALELFDTELKIVPVANSSGNPNPLVAALEQQVNVITTIKTGWRIYDPFNKIILDEYSLFDDLTFTASGMNILAATQALLGRKEAVKQTANSIGRSYAERILPFDRRVSRDYYVKGSPNFKIANRRARTGNWDGAAELWEKETHNLRPKIAGRACYNMAIINEINGNLNDAIRWAQKAYEDYNNRLALQYVNTLRARSYQNDRLNSQQQ